MKSFLTFVAGVGLGIAISWSHHKNKYENMVQEEVESLREMKDKKEETFVADESKKGNDVKEEIDNSAEEVYEEEMNKAKNIINYSGYSKKDEESICEKAVNGNPIHIITPEEFASQLGYDTDTFYIFEDDVIANDNNEKIDDVREMFGLTVCEIRSQFGIYEDDAVYIRDEKIQMDYEILRELDTYEKRNGE